MKENQLDQEFKITRAEWNAVHKDFKSCTWYGTKQNVMFARQLPKRITDTIDVTSAGVSIVHVTVKK